MNKFEEKYYYDISEGVKSLKELVSVLKEIKEVLKCLVESDNNRRYY